MAETPYNPSTDYAASYDALSRRIASNFAQQRAGLNQELATRGVQTSGVASIPSAALRTGEAGAMNDIAGQFALEQAHTGIQDRQAAEAFARQKELAQIGYDNTNAINRRMANAGLQTALISGGLGAVGGSLGGPGGYFASQVAAKKLAPQPTGLPGYNN
jgi:hypothetical protein